MSGRFPPGGRVMEPQMGSTGHSGLSAAGSRANITARRCRTPSSFTAATPFMVATRSPNLGDQPPTAASVFIPTMPRSCFLWFSRRERGTRRLSSPAAIRSWPGARPMAPRLWKKKIRKADRLGGILTGPGAHRLTVLGPEHGLLLAPDPGRSPASTIVRIRSTGMISVPDRPHAARGGRQLTWTTSPISSSTPITTPTQPGQPARFHTRPVRRPPSVPPT
jgi:hypothetical protein